MAFTTRLTVEVQGIPYENIEAFQAYIAKAGLQTGGTGAKVRTIVSCKGTPGLGGEPMCCVRSMAAQNILLAAYKAPTSIEELCGELGISAVYIEDDVEYLRDNMLLCEV